MSDGAFDRRQRMTTPERTDRWRTRLVSAPTRLDRDVLVRSTAVSG